MVRLEVILPILIPLLFGSLSLALWRSLPAQRLLAVAGTAALLGAGLWLLNAVWNDGVLAMQLGDWPAPYGISLVADLLGAIMVVLTGILGLAVALFSLGSISERHEHFGYFPLFHLLLAGVAGAFLTGDIFNLYVWIEVLLVASFALLILGGEREQMEGAIKYVTLNLVSSLLLLAAIGLLYGVAGTLNMADLAVKLGEVEETGLLITISLLFMVAFSIKAAAFPLFFWLPASYHTPQVAVSAIFAGLLTKVGVYALIRFFTLIFDQDIGFTHHLLLAWMAGFTMLTGVLGAATHFEFRRILAFHSVSQIGYMIMGLALMTPMALIGGIFYLMHHTLVKPTLFLISGITYALKGSHDLSRLGGLYRDRPWLGVLFLVAALSLAGLPPLSGFFAKLLIIWAGIEAEAWGLVAVAAVVGLLTLYSMVKIWAEAFWKAPPDDNVGEQALPPRQLALVYVPVAALVVLIVAFGVAIQPLYALTEVAADQLLDSTAYIEAVLGPDAGGDMP